MRKKYLFISGIILLSLTLVVLKFTGQQSQACVEYTSSFTENFQTDDYKDKANSSVANWPSGPVFLNYLGANFSITQPTGMGAKIYVADAGDFDGDGKPDLIGLDIGNNYRLVLIRNQYYDGNGDGVDDDGIVFKVDETKVFDTGLTCGPASITVGDYNGDGLLDFFFYKNGDDSFSYNNFVAVMYINCGTKTDPVFYPRTDSHNIDFTDRFKAAGIYCNWAANHLCTVDIDKDGDPDILVASQDKIFLMRNPGKLRWSLDNWEISELAYDQRTGYTAPVPPGNDGKSYPDRGTSAVAAADFDLDGDIDVVAGSVNNWPYLVYYQNDGTGHFTRSEIPIPDPSCTGTVALSVTDFKKDGRPDIFGATDAWNAGNQAHIWIFKNMGRTEMTDDEGNIYYEINWSFNCLNDCNPIIPPYYDVDMSCMLDYDGDGDTDLILADANHSGDYYLIINQLAGVYTLYGEAISTNVAAGLIDPRRYSITKARIVNLNQGVKGSATGLQIQYFLSNDGGQHWEPYKTFSGSDIRPFSDSGWFSFDYFGADLRWKAILTAPEDQMAEYQHASYDTPLIRQLTIEFTYVGRREYSRSSVATEVIDRSGQNRKLIIAASFVYPGWEGHLRAYDVTGMTALTNSYSNLRTVTSSDLSSDTGRWLAQGVELLWDAGEMLDARSPASRTIYTAINRNSPMAGPLERVDFNIANADLLSKYLQDYQNNAAGLIAFVRGFDRYWKLGDINHSTPAVVGPPDDDPRIMGSGYAEFKVALASRKKVIYVGANDGMLHCFDASTGEELWGYIPYNLLSRLKEMWPVDAARNLRYFSRKVYVDSSPSVADVYINNQWRTVLVCGQGEGKGTQPDGYSGMKNSTFYYYFALDVTDPLNPIPMWEFAGNYLKVGSGKNTKYYFTNGQTWSVPYIARVNLSSGPTWVAIMGSGYDPASLLYVGNTLAVVRIDNGQVVYANQISDLDSSSSKNSGNPFTNIYVSLPGSPNAVDINNDGTIEYVYTGDLDGRLWKLDCSGGNESKWSMTTIYTDRCLYPIITKPAIWLGAATSGSNYPRLYFGTGGDERAPADRKYSFVALIDDGKTTGTSAVEWYVGDPTETGIPANKCTGALTAGEKVWADPVISDYIVYFSTLKGSIETADPCQNLGEPGRLYARFIQPVLGVPVGGSALKNAQGQAIDYLVMASKARTAVTVGDRQRAGGSYKRDVYIQEYDSTIEKLEQPVGALLRIRSWREIYQIIR